MTSPPVRRENEDPAEQRDQRGHGIQPHPVRPRHVRRRSPQQHEADDLPHELHEDARHDQRVDHRAERKKPARIEIAPSTSSETCGKPLRRMQLAERAKEVAALRAAA